MSITGPYTVRVSPRTWAVCELRGHAQAQIRVRKSVTYVRKTGLIEGPTKNHSARTTPVPAFVARLLQTEVASPEDSDLVFPSARGGGYLTLGQARYAFQKATNAVEGCDGVRSA